VRSFIRPVVKKPTSREPESFCGALRALSLVGGTPPTGQTTSRWYAMRDLSEMRRKREKSSRTAICVTLGLVITCVNVSGDDMKHGPYYELSANLEGCRLQK